MLKHSRESLENKYKIRRGFTDEYDDEQGTIRVHFISEVMGLEVEWSEYHLSRNLPPVVEAVKKAVSANSLRLITDKSKYDMSAIEDLKKIPHPKWAKESLYSEAMIDLCVKCIEHEIDLDEMMKDMINIT